MNTPMTPDEIEQLARRRAKAKLGWYAHAIVYLVVNTFLFLLSTYGPGQRHWAIYPALGWGLGLALHGVSVFVLGTGSDLRERMIQKERERLQRRRQP
jgi:hypothetical protein